MQKIFVALVLTGLFFVSCASGPQTQTQTDSVAAPSQSVDLTTAKARADAAKEKAKAAKADIAVKADYDKGQSAYTEAESSGGVDKYIEAEKLFLASADAAEAKRAEAQRQIDKAKSDIKEVENAAEALRKEQSGQGSR
jgi:hypothetical protein